MEVWTAEVGHSVECVGHERGITSFKMCKQKEKNNLMLTILFLDSRNQKTYCLLGQLGLLLPGLINGTHITVFRLMFNLIKFNDL